MSVTALGFALGLGAIAPEAGFLGNPYLLETRRVYQELIYRDRMMFGHLHSGQVTIGAHPPEKKDMRKTHLIRKVPAGR